MGLIAPFNLPLELDALRALPSVHRVVRHLSDMKRIYHDQEAVAAILSAGDPPIYEFLELANPTSDDSLSFGLTRISPGKIGREYHMTKGHFHLNAGDEIYVGLAGRGLLVLQSRDGQGRELSMLPGSLCYVVTGWAHRTVNVGEDDLVFLSVWSATVEHDYETIDRHGFPQLVLADAGRVAVIRNERFTGR
jgi:glucose-6-phosphate isomerase